MFRTPFLFTGRIRRLEYGLSYIIFKVCIVLGVFVSRELQDGAISFIFLFIVLSWFLLAQGAKRCHDMGESGFLQLIPFYAFVMIFVEGTIGNNNNGIDPKDTNLNNSDKPRYEIKVNLPEGKTRLHVLNELTSLVLLNVLLVVVSYHYFKYYRVTLHMSVYLITMGCFFLFLVLTNKKSALPRLRPYLFRIRVLYAVLLYICIRLYTFSFLNSEFDVLKMPYELIYVCMILGITYVPFLIYPMLFKIDRIDG